MERFIFLPQLFSGGLSWTLNGSTTGSESSTTGTEGNDVISVNGSSTFTYETAGGKDTLFWTNGSESDSSVFGGNDVYTTIRYAGGSLSLVNESIHFTDRLVMNSGSYTYGETNDQVGVLSTTNSNVTIHSGAGRDVIIFGAVGSFYINTGDDADTIQSGSDAYYVERSNIITGEGNDSINLKDGTNNTVDAGTGDDTILFGGRYTSVYGGAGDDYFSINTFDSSLEYGSRLSRSHYSTINAGDGNDTIFISGTTLADGNVTILGGTGDDLFSLGAQANHLSIEGEDGQDSLIAVNPVSFLSVSLGNDSDLVSIYTDSENISIDAGDDNDTIISSANQSSLYGGGGSDYILVGDVIPISSVTVDGGADNDLIYFKSTVSGNTNSCILGGTGDDTIIASTSGWLDVDGGDGNDSISIKGQGSNTQILGVYSAGAGDDTVLTENVNNATINSNEGDDILSLYGAGTGNAGRYAANLLINTGDGDDSVVADTHSNGFSLSAGKGNDTIQLISGNQISVHGNENDDYIEINSSLTYAEVYGDSGDDTLAVTNGYYVTIDGGTGDDSILNYSGSSSISGGNGDDIITTTGRFGTVNGGNGDDTIYSSGSNAIIDAGAGDDIVDASGVYLSVVGGTGDDSITIGSNTLANHVFVDAGGDADIISVGSSTADITIQGNEGNDTIANQADSALIFGGEYIGSIDLYNSSTSVSSGSDTTGSSTIGSSSTQDSLVGSFGEFLENSSISSGDDVIISNANNVTINAGTGNDVISVSGSDNIIFAGEDRDKINLINAYNTTVLAGAGDDTINISTSRSATVYADDGDDWIEVGVGSDMLIYAEEGNDTIINDASTATINAGNGNNFVNSDINATSVYIYTGSDRDTIENYSGSSTILTSEGNDSILNNSDNTSIDAGAGSNFIDNTGNYSTIFAGNGDDTLDLKRTTYGQIDLGNGSNLIYSTLGTVEQTSINTGTGNDSISIQTFRNSTLETGAGDDLVSVAGGSNAISLGAGNDSLELWGNNTTVDAGAGDDSILIAGESMLAATTLSFDVADVIVNAGSGNDIVKFYEPTADDAGSDILVDVSGNVTINGGKGNDTLYAHDGSDVFQYANGDGNDIIYNFNGSEDLVDITRGRLNNYYTSGSDRILQIGRGNVTLVGAGSMTISIRDSSGSIEIDGSDLGSEVIDDGSDGSIYEPEDDAVGNGLGFSVRGATIQSGWNETGSRLVVVGSDGKVDLSTGSELGSDGFYNATIMIDEETSAGTVAANSTNSLGNDFIFSRGLIARSWNISMASGDDTVQIQNMNGTAVNTGAGNDYVSVSAALAADLTVTGGDGNDVFYVRSAAVSDLDLQHTVTITDFNNDDVLMLDAGLESITSDFFDGTQILNYPNAHQASRDGVYARNVISLSSTSQGYSSINAANYNESIVGSNAVDSSTKLIWMNGSTSSNANFTSNRDNSILLFTGTNSTGDNVTLGGSYGDTIHAGADDTIHAGDGDDLIHVDSGSGAVIDSGNGNDTIYTGDSTKVIFNAEQTGEDLVLNWTGGTNADELILSALPSTMYVDSASGDLILRSSNSTNSTGSTTADGSDTSSSETDSSLSETVATMSIRATSGNMASTMNVKYSLDGSEGVLRVANNSDHEVTYDSNVTFYEGVSLGTVVVSGDSGAVVNLNSDSVTYSNIANINASQAEADAVLIGDTNDNVITAGQIATTLQGGGGNDTLIGGIGADVFYYATDDGNVTVSNGGTEDALDLNEWDESIISGNYQITNDGIVFALGSNQTLTVLGNSIEHISIRGSDGSTYEHTINYGSGVIGSLNPGSGLISGSTFGSDSTGSGTTGSDSTGSDSTGSDSTGSSSSGSSGSSSTGSSSSGSRYSGSHAEDSYTRPENSNIPNSLIASESIGTSLAVNEIGFVANDAPTLTGSLAVPGPNYVYIGGNGITTISPTEIADSDYDGTITVNASNHAATYTANNDEDQNLTFAGTTKIGTWNTSMAGGDDKIHVLNVLSGSMNGGDGHDYFHITTFLAGDITLTGGTSSDEEYNVYYANSDSVSSASDQYTIHVVDPDFDNGDVLLIDAGVDNLTADFFGDAKFYNYANSVEAATSGLYAQTVFDASQAVSKANMSFSMVHVADKSKVTLSADNTFNEDLETNLLWSNSKSASMNFSNTQDGELLIFTNTNSTGDLVSLGGDYNDTIYAGNSDTINAGGGNDIISVESGTAGRRAYVNGGEGDDTIVAGRATRVVFDNSDGEDVVINWEVGERADNQADILELDTKPTSASINSSGQLVLESDNQLMTISRGSGTFTSETEVLYNSNGSEGTALFTDSTHQLNYSRYVTYYNGGENGTLNVNANYVASIDLSTSKFDNISNVDASNATGRLNIGGDSSNNVIHGGTTSTTLWGGGGNDTLIGGTGEDHFKYTSAEGNVTVTGASSNDVVDLTEWNYNAVSNKLSFSDDGIVFAYGENQSLNIVGNSMTEFKFADGTHTANYSDKSFS